MLYVEGPLGSGKTDRLIAEVKRLIQKHPSQSILVLCCQHARKKEFTQRLLTQLSCPMGELSIYTYSGYVRTSLFNFWPEVEAQLNPPTEVSSFPGASAIRPMLSGMEDSELLLKRLLTEQKLKNPSAFDDFPGTEAALIKQLIRRIRLRSENRLSRPEMTRRSHLLAEICVPETAEIERQFDHLSYTLRVLDANKQLDVFHGILESSELFQHWIKTHVKHLIVDDVDETIPAQQAFIKFLAPTLETLILSTDIDGGSRRGYLNAYPYDWEALKALKPGETIVLNREDSVAKDAAILLNNWRTTTDTDFLPLNHVLVNRDSALTRVEMLDQVVHDMLRLLEQGYQPGDFSVVTPVNDPLAIYVLKNRLSKRAIHLQLLSGTQRPFDNPVCRGFLYLLQWANSRRWSYYLSPIEYKTIFSHLLKLHLIDPGVVDRLVEKMVAFQQVNESSLTLDWDSLTTDEDFSPHTETRRRYELLINWLTTAQDLSFEAQMLHGFSHLTTLFATDKDTFSDIKKLIESYEKQRTLFARWHASNHDNESENEDWEQFNRLWLSQAKTGIVADTPDTPMDIDPTAVILGTPQKLIDFEARRKIYFWLDVGSREWARTDNAPLYNAWVHSAVWDGSTADFTEEAREAFVRVRAAHLTRTLMLLALEQVRTYASELDDQGFNQQGALKSRLISQITDPLKRESLQRASLRVDQQSVLDYRSGTMAITAVPGAGKTFVNVELILELIEQGLEPDEILVLTYMDSAAKTMLSRIKGKLDQVTVKLPIISTIHSLAFRILTENDHALYLGFLPEDIQILDDYEQNEILKAISEHTSMGENQPRGQSLRTLTRGISYAKTQGLTIKRLQQFLQAHPQSFGLRQFIPSFQLYQNRLTEKGYLDFTDLILKAVALLERYPDIRSYYQRKFRVIIEDEAQDSSLLLQRFITLISGGSPNLIRTGDTNQSITTTFSSADTSVFRNFIQTANQVVTMDRSGRCAPEIIHLANQWVRRVGKISQLAQAFQPVDIVCLSEKDFGKNPMILFPPEARLFDIDRDEEHWIAERIRAIKKTNPELSIAVLPAYNEQVNRMAAILQSKGIPAISLSEKLGMNPVFSVLLAYLQLIATPSEPVNQVRLFEAMVEARLFPNNPERKAILTERAILYQSPNTLDDEFLQQLYYDVIDFSRDGLGSNIAQLLIRMTDHLFASVEDRSNGYLCAIQARDILRQFYDVDHLSPLELVIQQFQLLQRSPKNKKSFTELLNDTGKDFVQVMTLHKSKGQEFDVVFMPFMRKIKIDFNADDKLVRELDSVLADGPLPDSYMEKSIRTKAEEKARLIYVGLTRAKRGLYLTAHTQYHNRYSRQEQAEPSIGYTILAEIIELNQREETGVTLG